MIVLRVLQVSVWLLTLFFAATAFYYLFTGEKSSGPALYFSLASAGVIMSLLMHFGIKALKKHL